MVTICVDGENKTHKITDWTLWAGNDDREVMLTCHFRSGRKYTRPLSVCQITPTVNLRNVFLERKGNAVTSRAERVIIYGDKYAAVYYREGERPYIMKTTGLDFQQCSAFTEHAVFNYLCRVANERIFYARGNNRNIDENILRQIKKIVSHPDTALHAYCSGQSKKRDSPWGLIFPFGLNESQLLAVERAFSSQISVIEGPPGTGKTLLAKAVAGEAKVPFFSLSGSAFVEMYVGVGASRVRDLFKQAQQMAPCIIFIDEIDAIGKSRDSQLGGNDEREQTLNQLLAEMDGFDSNKGLLLLAATNRPEILDPALLRPGRFDRRIIVDKPDLKGRIDVLKVHAKDVKMDETVNLEEIALATSGAVGSDLANMINEAAINAVKKGRNVVSQADLFEAVEVVLVGKEKKDRIMSQKERRIVSYHEVGHALVTALQKDAEPVQKITIVPRTMGALGYVMQTPEEEKFLNTKAELEAMLVTALAGRAAEELVFDTVTTGASNDIEQATKIARAMVTQYGMSEKFGLIGLESIQNRYLDGRAVMNCGEATAAEIDQEVMKMLKGAYAEAKRMLSEHRETMDQIAGFLIEKETITGKEFMKIYRRCEGIPEPEEKKEENPVKEQTIEMPKKEADTEAAQQEEKETQKKVERDEDGFILPQKRD